MDTVGRATPDVAVLVDAHAVAVARFNLVKNIAAGERGLIGPDIEDANVLARTVAGLVASLSYEEPALVGRKGEPIRSVEIVRHNPNVAAFGVEAVDCRRLFRGLPSAFIIVRYSVERVGEPDRAIRFHDDIVRCVQPL